MIPASKNKQVLVADDDIDLREIIAFIMTSKGARDNSLRS